MKMQNEIRNIVIVYRPRKPRARQLGKEVAKWFESKNITAFSHPNQKPLSGTEPLPENMLEEIDLALVLGGDGTYLNAIRLVGEYTIPILGINLGGLGFLTETSSRKMYKLLERALKKEMKPKKLSMLDIKVQRQGGETQVYNALNDIVIERGRDGRLINVEITSGGQYVTDLKADGVIICSPTGSTAYNLSAGGPIVHPDVSAVVVTPICPHSLTNRPIVLPDDQVLELTISRPTQRAMLTVDGQPYEGLRYEDKIEIRKGAPHYKLSSPDYDYFEIIRTKLSFGHRD
jgi:NAD+ kinase